jgi:hypothetical protein
VSQAITPATSVETTQRGEVTPAEWERVRRTALLVAAGGAAAFVVLSLIYWLLHREEGPKQLFVSYLVGYNYWLGTALGGLVFLMLQYVTGGAWGLFLRRILEASASLIVPLAVLFIPIILALPIVYEEYGRWVPKHTEPKLQFKAYWLSAPAVTVKTILYFAIWIGMASLFRRWSRQQDEGADGRLLEHCETLGAPGIVIYALTITFASIDWVMSLEPEWYSTIFPVMFAVGQLLNGYAFALIVFLLLSDRPPFAGAIQAAHMRDFGSLLLAFVMFWAYMAVSQFLLIWVGNLPEESPWYLLRSRGGWQFVASFIALFHFAVPFLLLLLRDIKEHRGRLLAVAAGLLVMRFIDLFWWIEPPLDHHGQYFYWLLDIAAWAAMGGLCVWWFAGQLRSRPLLPWNDPNLAEVLRHE